MIQTVVKRDGRIVGFDKEKIATAIRMAMYHTEIGEDSYVTDYRAFKGQEWPDAELCIDLEDLLEELTGMYPEFFEPDDCIMFEA